MSDLLKKTVKRAVIGFVTGMILMNLISFVVGKLTGRPGIVSEALAGRLGGETPAIMVQTLLDGIFFSIAMAGVSFHLIEEWSMLKSAVCHFLTMFCTMMPLALFLGWIPLRPLPVIAFTALLVLIFILIWWILYLHYKKEVRELNSLLKEHNKGRR